MGRRNWKNTKHSSSLVAAIDSGAADEIGGLAEEMGEWRDNMEESFGHTAKFEEVSDAADTLEEQQSELEQAVSELLEALADGDGDEDEGGEDEDEGDEEDEEDGDGDGVVEWTEMVPYGRNSAPRWMRRDNALAPVQAGLAHIEDLTAMRDDFLGKGGDPAEEFGLDDDAWEAVTEAAATLEGVLGEIAEVSFPAMR